MAATVIMTEEVASAESRMVCLVTRRWLQIPTKPNHIEAPDEKAVGNMAGGFLWFQIILLVIFYMAPPPDPDLIVKDRKLRIVEDCECRRGHRQRLADRAE